jgi:hypothetical protein
MERDGTHLVAAHVFAGPPGDGSFSFGLHYFAGSLIGLTGFGGNGCGQYGCGVVFQLTP